MWLRASKLLLVAVILTGCATDLPKKSSKPTPVDKPFRVCGENESPVVDNCKRLGPTAPITIRGVHE
jgi:hypothetical protein